MSTHLIKSFLKYLELAAHADIVIEKRDYLCPEWTLLAEDYKVTTLLLLLLLPPPSPILLLLLALLLLLPLPPPPLLLLLLLLLLVMRTCTSPHLKSHTCHK